MWKLGLTFSDPQIFEHENLTEDFEGVYEGDESYKLESTTTKKLLSNLKFCHSSKYLCHKIFKI